MNKNTDNDENGITIHLYIRGNCGNQFFQYAFARSIQERIGGKLVVNYFRVRQDKKALPESDNLLKLFNTVDYKYESNPGFGGFIFRALKAIQKLFRLNTFEKRTYRFYLWCAKNLPKYGIYYFDVAYYPFDIVARKNIYINGYFESPRYFEEIDDKICCELKPREEALESNREFYEEILTSESVCVTLKRKDTENERYKYSISYFAWAMEYISRKIDNPIFFIFSDDIEWCKNNIPNDYDLRYENSGNPIWEKIRLMSACKHFIIYNSTFSWWAQHLSGNRDKVVIAPMSWMERSDQPVDIYEQGWRYINKEGQLAYNHE